MNPDLLDILEMAIAAQKTKLEPEEPKTVQDLLNEIEQEERDVYDNKDDVSMSKLEAIDLSIQDIILNTLRRPGTISLESANTLRSLADLRKELL